MTNDFEMLERFIAREGTNHEGHALDRIEAELANATSDALGEKLDLEQALLAAEAERDRYREMLRQHGCVIFDFSGRCHCGHLNTSCDRPTLEGAYQA